MLSLLIHVALALVFLVAPGEKEEIGSDHVDIDLVAPRLAAPQRLNQQKGEAAARAARGDPASEEPTGGASATDADALALMASADRRDDDSSERSPWVVPAPVVAEQQSAGQQSADPDAEQRVDTAQTTRADRQRQQREQRAAAAKKQRARAKDPRIAQPGGPDRAARSASSSAEARAKARPSDRGDRAAPNDDTDRPRQVVRKKTTELAARGQPTAMEARLTEIDADQPAEVDPTRLLAAVESERDRRRIAVERWRAEHSRRERRAAARFALMTGRRGTSGARGSGPGAPAAGTTSRARAGRGERRARGRAAVDASGRQVDGPPGGLRYGLQFYLSGRQKLTSKVVRPPELIALPRKDCRLRDPSTTPTTVRMLVTLEGGVDVAYIKHASGSQAFDRCALKQVRAMRFRPGTDGSGKPLDVWIHVRVSPSFSLADLR